MSTTVAQQTELEKALARCVYFVEFRFKSSTVYLTSWNHNIEWSGFTWIGAGSLLNISSITETESVESSAVTFSLTAADMSWLAFAIGDDAEYRKRPVIMYMCPLTESYQLEGTPIRCWYGFGDTLGMSIDGTEAGISLKCESAAYAFKRRPTIKMNAVQQKTKYPTDTGFDHLHDIITNPTVWLSKLFQKQ